MGLGKTRIGHESQQEASRTHGHDKRTRELSPRRDKFFDAIKAAYLSIAKTTGLGRTGGSSEERDWATCGGVIPDFMLMKAGQAMGWGNVKGRTISAQEIGDAAWGRTTPSRHQDSRQLKEAEETREVSCREETLKLRTMGLAEEKAQSFELQA